MEQLLACPEVNPNCNDTSSTNAALILILPFAILFAVTVARAVAIVFPAHRWPGVVLGSVGTVIFLVFFSTSLASAFGWAVAVVGLALFTGRRGRTT